jgi:hypothetical protein
MILTKHLIANIVLPDEIPEKLLVHASLVQYSGVPESATELNCFGEDGLGFFEAEVAS